MTSTVNKIGDWTMEKEAKSKQGSETEIQKYERGKFHYTVALATINMRVQCGISVPRICRAISDPGATISSISKGFVEENKIPTIRCEKAIMGVEGSPMILSEKIKAYIIPHFTSDIMVPAELYVLSNLKGCHPTSEIEASKDEIKHLKLADENFDKPAPIDALLGADIYRLHICKNNKKKRNI